MAHTIEIFNRKTNEIVETKTVENLKGFMMYWSMQCDNKTYGYRHVTEREE